MRSLRTLLPLAAAFPVSVFASVLFATGASAHVKWFCAHSVAGQPRVLENVLCPQFEYLIGFSALALIVGCLIEGTSLGAAMIRSLDVATDFIRDHTETLFRAGCAFFFVSIWAVGGIILTPELQMNSAIVGAIQLGIAAGMLSRRTMPFSGLGIAALFGIAVWNYGVFHLADYPVFLGVAAYLVLQGMERPVLNVRPIDIVRWSAGITLMWASIEKWAYPDWSFPLFLQNPQLAMGFEPEFFMRAAGAVEFALAFALVWTPLVSRVAAVILTGMFVSAVFPFGKIDLIGHTLIVVSLIAIIADNRGRTALVRYPVLVPVAYAAALATFLFVYYTAHSLLFGAPSTGLADSGLLDLASSLFDVDHQFHFRMNAA